jgi:hypothetical protein
MQMKKLKSLECESHTRIAALIVESNKIRSEILEIGSGYFPSTITDLVLAGFERGTLAKLRRKMDGYFTKNNPGKPSPYSRTTMTPQR